MQLEQTCWRGLVMEHPREWEISRVSSANEPGQCCFSDRLYQRLSVRWRPLKYLPNLDLILKKYSHKERRGDDIELTELAGAPEPWRGVVRQNVETTIVHAGRFFREEKLLVEVTMVWPQGRDRDLENLILSSVAPQEVENGRRLWQAMGLSVLVAEDVELTSASLRVGRVRWNFSRRRKGAEVLRVERYAMPSMWLKTPLREWLVRQAHGESETVREDFRMINKHRGEQLITTRKVSILSTLRGRRELQVALAWLCPGENRLYRISCTQLCGGDRISLPEHLEVRCCRPVPVVERTATGI